MDVCISSVNQRLRGQHLSVALVYVCRLRDYSELKTGNRATGLIFSSSSMSQKFGWAIGTGGNRLAARILWLPGKRSAK